MILKDKNKDFKFRCKTRNQRDMWYDYIYGIIQECASSNFDLEFNSK